MLPIFSALQPLVPLNPPASSNPHSSPTSWPQEDYVSVDGELNIMAVVTLRKAWVRQMQGPILPLTLPQQQLSCKVTWAGRMRACPQECCAVEDVQVSQHGSGMSTQLPASICVMPLGRCNLGTLFAPPDGGIMRRGSHGQLWSNGD